MAPGCRRRASRRRSRSAATRPPYNRPVTIAILVLLAYAAISAFSGGPSQGVPPPHGTFQAGFEQGFQGFNLAGVGEVDPTVVETPRGSGEHAARFRLEGSEGRSELIVGGTGDQSNSETIEFGDGDEGWLGFSFDILHMTYGSPRFWNLIMQFKGEGEGSPNFAIQIGREGSDRGIWTSGSAMGSSRFLAQVSERQWHRVELHFRASNHGSGFYRLFLDGRLIDQRQRVSLIPSNRRNAYIKLGLYRDGADLNGTSTTLVDSVSIGRTRASVSASGR